MTRVYRTVKSSPRPRLWGQCLGRRRLPPPLTSGRPSLPRLRPLTRAGSPWEICLRLRLLITEVMEVHQRLRREKSQLNPRDRLNHSSQGSLGSSDQCSTCHRLKCSVGVRKLIPAKPQVCLSCHCRCTKSLFICNQNAWTFTIFSLISLIWLTMCWINGMCLDLLDNGIGAHNDSNWFSKIYITTSLNFKDIVPVRQGSQMKRTQAPPPPPGKPPLPPGPPPSSRSWTSVS